MTIQYCSDLHLERPENHAWWKKRPIVPAADTLILAGDILPFAEMDQFPDFFNYLSDNFKATYWLPGNHEYYSSDILHRSGSFREAIRSNVLLLNNQVELIEDITIIFSTLWSHISPAAEWDIARYVTDFRSITRDGERFRPLHSNRLHRECLQFIETVVAAATTSKIVVATHHIPTFLHYPAKYKSSPVNEAFATELYDYIEQSGINAWIYGHHHCNSPEFVIGKTRMLTNQLGYIRRREYDGFRKDAVIAI
jgi:predicted phosphohydrolase